MKQNALIGSSGFVGSNLAAQHTFQHLYNSKNIEEIEGKSFDFLAIAGIPAVKWWANAHPQEDWVCIQRLLNALKKVEAKETVLISTVDVYPCPVDVNEETALSTEVEHPSYTYGKHRLMAEMALQRQFPNLVIVRLPALFGNGLKKNVIFDLLHDNLLEKINPLARFQYYSLDCLWDDIERVRKAGVRLINFATEPVTTSEILSRFFADKSVGPAATPAPSYDFRSIYAHLWNRHDGYLYSKEAVLDHLSIFIQRSKP